MSFNHYVDNVDNTYRKYSSSSMSKEYDNAYKATGDIESTVESIADEISEDSSLDTKQEAVIAILEIAAHVVEGNMSELGSQIRKSFDYYMLGGTIEDIVAKFRPEELEAVRRDGNLAKEMRLSQQHADDYALDLQLAKTLEHIAQKISTGTDGSSYAKPIDVDLL